MNLSFAINEDSRQMFVTGRVVSRTAGTNLEEYWQVNNVSVTYLEKIETWIYKYAQPTLQHTNVYMSWIRKMLRYNQQKRISAEELYNIIYDFAITNKIPICIPHNGDKDIIISKFSERKWNFNEGQLKIMYACFETAADFRTACKFLCDMQMVKQTIIYMILKKRFLKKLFKVLKTIT